MWFKSYEHFHLLPTDGNDAQQSLIYIKKGGFACQWLENVDMHMYANFDQNIPCGSRVINIFTNC